MLYSTKALFRFHYIGQQCLKFNRTHALAGQLKVQETLAKNLVGSAENNQEARDYVSPSKKDLELKQEIEKCYSRLDLSFENTKEAYRSKTNRDLTRGILVLKLCGIPALSRRNQEILKWTRKFAGAKLFRWIMKSSFYGHFVAGETQNEIKPVVVKMRQFGVKAIMDYSVEADISTEEAVEKEVKSTISASKVGTDKEFKVLTVPVSAAKSELVSADDTKKEIPETLGPFPEDIRRYKSHREFGDRREGVVSARTYFYDGEPECDRNLETFLNCIDAVSHATESSGFAAIKLTALGRPQLLLQLSEVLEQSQQFYRMLTDSSWENLVESRLSEANFLAKLKDFGIRTDSEKVQQWFAQADFDEDGFVDLYEWGRLLDQNIRLGSLFQVLNLRTGQMEPLIKQLTAKEERQFENMMTRLNSLVKRAEERNVRLMVDAEQTYFQPAISRLTLELMRKCNKEKPVVFNTYQCYLKSAMKDVQVDMHLAGREKFHFGAKLVRGAYMEQERRRSLALGYEDPINSTYEGTSAMYKEVLASILDEVEVREPGGVSVLVATHNEDSVRYAVNEMKRRGIGPDQKIVCFGQLYGMCDQVSFPLGQAGYSVYKYVPFGPVEEVLPYLSRRAQENSSIVSTAEKERNLMWSELKRRLFNLEWLHKIPSHGPKDGKGSSGSSLPQDEETEKRLNQLV